MPLPLAIGIYFVIWWIALFAILPFGVRTQQEEQSIVPGTPESAPVAPLLVQKLIATTIAASVLFAFVYWILTTSGLTLDSIPFLPKY